MAILDSYPFGKKARKQEKRALNKPGQTHRRGDKERTRRVVHVVNGCNKREEQHVAVHNAASKVTAVSMLRLKPVRVKVYVAPAWLKEADPAAVIEAPATRPVYEPAHKTVEGGAKKLTDKKSRRKAISSLAKRV